jgi:glutamine cyclotransferase
MIAAALLLCAALATVWALVHQPATVRWSVEIVRSYPHDTRAYTQGLAYEDGVLFEGTGQYGESTLRRVELESGRVLQAVRLPNNMFGEGITVRGGEVFQLTWRNQIGIVYDKSTFRELRRFRYAGEGWGLTHDGTHLIMSDGSSTLRFLDPKTFRVVRQLIVRSGGRRVANLNELEYVGGEILANIWYKDYLARISPASGEVLGWIDLQTLVPAGLDREQCANGIAYDAENDRLFVTGKNWPQLYEIRLVSP